MKFTEFQLNVSEGDAATYKGKHVQIAELNRNMFSGIADNGAVIIGSCFDLEPPKA